MKQKKHSQIQRILRLENIVAQMYVKLEALKLIIDKQIKKAPKYARLIIGLSEPNIKIEISIDKNIKLIADDFFVYLNFKLWNTFLNKLDAFTCSIAFIVGIEKMASTSSPTKKIFVKFKNEKIGSIFRPRFSLK